MDQEEVSEEEAPEFVVDEEEEEEEDWVCTSGCFRQEPTLFFLGACFALQKDLVAIGRRRPPLFQFCALPSCPQLPCLTYASPDPYLQPLFPPSSPTDAFVAERSKAPV